MHQQLFHGAHHEPRRLTVSVPVTVISPQGSSEIETQQQWHKHTALHQITVRQRPLFSLPASEEDCHHCMCGPRSAADSVDGWCAIS